MFQVMAAWGQVTERAFARMVVKPDWNVSSVVGDDGRDHVVSVTRELEKPFGDLIRFRVAGRPERPAASSSWRRCRATTPRSCAPP
jgi:poly(3-hydroxybutyrate) depolymerase